jgi:hypothetical protein
MNFGIGNRGKVLKASAAVGLAGLCATGVASGVACPLLMGAAGLLAFSAWHRQGAQSCAACEVDTTEPGKRS